jgi:hypothetical protein
MKQKTTQTLLLIFSSLLLLVSVTVSARAKSQPQDRANFTGVWNTVTSKGEKYLITLRHERSDYKNVIGSYHSLSGVTGSYQPWDGSIYGFVKVSASTSHPALQSAGSIKGTVEGSVLRFTWSQDNGRGSGRFTLSSEGEAFQGTFSATKNPDDTSGGTWNGTRVYSFAGAWRGKFGDGGFELVLQQAGSQVTGQINLNSVIFDIKGGIADFNNKLRFTIVRPAMVLPNGAMLSPMQSVGTGELVMDRGGKSFKGKILNVDSGGTKVGR